MQTVPQRLPTLAEIESAAKLIYRSMPPTPQYRWPLLEARAGHELWVKHENHTPVGAFKVRGALVYFEELLARDEQGSGVICATRGNHGQAVAFAASRANVTTVVVVPHRNSREKNAAMRALGAELIEHGDDFQASLDFARQLAQERGLHFVPSFHPALVRGAATLSLELLRAAPHLDAVYAPIGLGSCVSGLLSAVAALGATTEVVLTVAENAPAYARSLEAGASVSAATHTLADGMACRVPNPDALSLLLERRPRVVTVSDERIAEAMRIYFTDTHNVVKGAGAASLAAALGDSKRTAYRAVAVIVTGGNVDAEVFARILAG
jgi:threonine dehydratase